MPTRLLRDWTDSEPINGLTCQAECFFVRLIMKADDFGRYSASPKLLRSLLFPLKDGLRDTDITRWIAECEKAGLIAVYTHEGKPFLHIPKFGQQVRAKVSKFPDPDDAKHLQTDANTCLQMRSYANAYSETDTDICPPAADPVPDPNWLRFWNLYPQPGRERSSKKDTEAQWKAQKCDTCADDVFQGLEKFKASQQWQKDGGEFIPGVHRFLNKRRWESAPDPNSHAVSATARELGRLKTL